VVNRVDQHPHSVADSFSYEVDNEASGYELSDGSRIAVVGSGPAGSFFAYFLLRMAESVGLDIEVDIFDPRAFSRCGPAGCNHCGGVVSESLVQILATEGINLSRDVVQRGIDAYLVHTDAGSVPIASPAEECRIAALYRGNGPREGCEAASGSFDGFLQNMAVQRGARVVRQLVTGVHWDDGFPVLQHAANSGERYDLLAVATGVNSNFLQRLEDGPGDIARPKSTRTYICEFRLGTDGVKQVLGNAVHVFLLTLPRLEFAAVVPKGEYATAIMVGEDLDQALVHEFLTDPVVQNAFPSATAPCVCSCSPLINMGAKKRPYGDRIVMIGDSGVTRLYKDGIGSAYRTSKAAASTAVFHGVSRDDFARHFWPACRTIANDNAIGRFMFAASGILKHSAYLRRVVHRMVAREQALPGRRPHMSKMLWNMFTGSAPYTEILRDAMHPGFFGNFLMSMAREVLPATAHGGSGETVR